MAPEPHKFSQFTYTRGFPSRRVRESGGEFQSASALPTISVVSGADVVGFREPPLRLTYQTVLSQGHRLQSSVPGYFVRFETRSDLHLRLLPTCRGNR